MLMPDNTPSFRSFQGIVAIYVFLFEAFQALSVRTVFLPSLVQPLCLVVKKAYLYKWPPAFCFICLSVSFQASLASAGGDDAQQCEAASKFAEHRGVC